MSETAALGFSYRNILDKDGRKEIVFQSHVAADATVEELNDILDKVRVAVDRQAAVYELRQARLDLTGHLQKILEIENLLLAQEETYKTSWEANGRKGDWSSDQLPAKEKHAKVATLQSLQKYRDGAIFLDKEIKRLVQLVDGHALDLGANSYAGQSGG